MNSAIHIGYLGGRRKLFWNTTEATKKIIPFLIQAIKIDGLKDVFQSPTKPWFLGGVEFWRKGILVVEAFITGTARQDKPSQEISCSLQNGPSQASKVVFLHVFIHQLLESAVFPRLHEVDRFHHSDRFYVSIPTNIGG